jgi:hypothetical protein
MIVFVFGRLDKVGYRFHVKKVIPLHAMEALGGRGGIAPAHS